MHELCFGRPVLQELGVFLGRHLDDAVREPYHPDVNGRRRRERRAVHGRYERVLSGAGRLERIAGGVALVGIEVRSGDDVVAVGASCSLLLA